MKTSEKNIILSVNNLKIGFKSPSDVEVVHNIDFEIEKSKITALVGESGSGKSLTALSILGLTKLIKNSYIDGEILFFRNNKSINLSSLSEKNYEKIRGKRIAMIFQDPQSSFNPIKRCGNQIVEIVMLHQGVKSSEAKDIALGIFEKMNLDKRIFDSYPHQISGGELQRVGISIVLASKPDLLIADEPTTNLDASLKKKILDLLLKIKEETGISILYISHDLNAVKYVADEVMLMYKGKIIEKGNKKDFFGNPKNGYSKELIDSFFNLKLKQQDDVTSNHDLLEVTNLNKAFSKASILPFLSNKQYVKALSDINFKVGKGDIIGIIGESGSGKTTLARILMRLIDFDTGRIVFLGEEISKFSKEKIRQLRKDMQIVFQNPLSSLNPAIKIKKLIAEPLEIHKLCTGIKDKKKKILQLIDSVGLKEELLDRYPSQLSGGEGQRVAIARALAVEPRLLILDESISSLDKIAQKEVLNLLLELKGKYDLSYIFITHDLMVSKYFCNKLLILKNGEIIERGSPKKIFNNPEKTYTKKLLDAIL